MAHTNRIELVLGVRTHIWACGCQRRLRAKYRPAKVVHAEVCSKCLRLAEYNGTRMVYYFDQLMDTVDRTIRQAAVLTRHVRNGAG